MNDPKSQPGQRSVQNEGDDNIYEEINDPWVAKVREQLEEWRD